jgi:ketosteroid isomerase-like protein
VGRHSNSIAALALVASLAVAGSGPVGCAPRLTEQTSVVNTESNNTLGLSPLQRGQLRVETLEAAKAGWDAWRNQDVAGMRKYFAADLVKKYVDILDGIKAQGRKRVREFNVTSFDVTEMNNEGTQVIADVKFSDRSYYIQKSGAKTTPSNKKSAAQLTLEKQPDGSWMIVRLFAEADILK